MTFPRRDPLLTAQFLVFGARQKPKSEKPFRNVRIGEKARSEAYLPYAGIYRLYRSFWFLQLDKTEKRRKPFRYGEVSEKARSETLFLTQGFITYGAVSGFRS